MANKEEDDRSSTTETDLDSDLPNKTADELKNLEMGFDELGKKAENLKKRVENSKKKLKEVDIYAYTKQFVEPKFPELEASIASLKKSIMPDDESAKLARDMKNLKMCFDELKNVDTDKIADELKNLKMGFDELGKKAENLKQRVGNSQKKLEIYTCTKQLLEAKFPEPDESIASLKRSIMCDDKIGESSDDNEELMKKLKELKGMDEYEKKLKEMKIYRERKVQQIESAIASLEGLMEGESSNILDSENQEPVIKEARDGESFSLISSSTEDDDNDEELKKEEDYSDVKKRFLEKMMSESDDDDDLDNENQQGSNADIGDDIVTNIEGLKEDMIKDLFNY